MPLREGLGVRCGSDPWGHTYELLPDFFASRIDNLYALLDEQHLSTVSFMLHHTLKALSLS